MKLSNLALFHITDKDDQCTPHMIRLKIARGNPKSIRVDFIKDQLIQSYVFSRSTLIAAKPLLALDLAIEWIAS